MFEHLFSEHGLSLDRLRSLIEVAEAGSIAKAVDRDHVRQSQYSRQIKELEAFFGMELTRKKARQLVLTSAGEELVKLTKEYLISLDYFKSNAKKLPRRFSLGAGDSLHTWMVSPILNQLAKDRIPWLFSLQNLRNGEIARRLISMDLDLGILRKSAITSDLLEYKVLKRVEYALYVPDILVPHGKKSDIKWMMENIPLATLSFESSFHNQLEETCRKSGIRFNVSLQTQSFPFASRLLQEKSCMAVLPSIAEIDLNDEYIKVPTSLFAPLGRDIALAWNPRLLKVRPAARQVIEYFLANIGQGTPGD